MAHYRKIDIRIWNDQKFNQLSDDAKIIFFQLLTHPNLLPIGAMRGSIFGLSYDLRWSIKRYKPAFNEITQLGMIKLDEVLPLIWLPNFLKYNKPESPNVVRSWKSYPDYLPECALKLELMLAVERLVNLMPEAYRQAFQEAFPKPSLNQEQEQEQKQEQDKELKFFSTNHFIHNALNNSPNQALAKSQAIEVLNFLNERALKNHEPTDVNLKQVLERMAEGASPDVCRAIIAKKVRSWKGNSKMDSSLNPYTLFRKENFDRYKGELTTPKEIEFDDTE